MSSTPGKSQPPADPVRILMLEDNAVDAELVVRRLSTDGLSFVNRIVSSELGFRREIAEFAPQIILSDFSLPQFDGLTALKVARSLASSTPFVFVSGTIGEERAIEALKSGAADYVLKENLVRLVPAIQNALRQAEVAHARDLAEEMLRRSESRLQDIIDSSADWIWECDTEGRFSFSSPSVEAMLGYDWHELLGRSSFNFVLSGDRAQLEEAFAELHGGGNAAGSQVLRWKHKNGKVRWLERKMVALRDDKAAIRGFRGIDRDVTTRVVQEARIARLNRALRFMSGANSAIVHLRNRRRLLSEACRLAVQVGGYGMATIYLRPRQDRSAEPIVCRAVGRKHSTSTRPPREPLYGDGPAARAIATKEAVIVPDLADLNIPLPDRELLLGMGLRACIALPLVIDGTAIGTVQLHSDESDVFGETEIALLRQVTGNITFSLQYLHSKESAQYLEFFDTLTALANRTLYLQRLDAMIQSARQSERGLTLLVLDIAGLTVVNDGLGHHAGDLLLQLVAERLKNTFGDSNCLCHLGSGRYAVAAIDAGEPEEAATLLRERVDYLFAQPFLLNDQELRISIKAGFAHYPEGGEDGEALLQRAQSALDRAKRAGEQYLRHNPSMEAEASERLSMTNRLRKAVAEERFALHYQPKLELGTGAITGAEALLRWPGKADGSISPGVFVPMLESLGLVDAVGRWVIAQALTESAAAFDRRAPGFRVAVNVSPMQLRRTEFVDEVLGVLERVPHGSIRLELEVTESMLMADSQRAGAMLKRLRDSGITVAIDDFGTGHSSLQILSRLPLDVLKIDRTFVRDVTTNLSNRMIVQTTITLAKSLGLKTVAEGVETREQLDVLGELGCDAVQGYLVRRPAPAPELALWLATAQGEAGE
ncbi:MAG TPA: EAL domain-containing protein [Gammaproteobacteria bacterium]|nr:EAL domain-containing protein [Gammaproteobacteria bacterium]